MIATAHGRSGCLALLLQAGAHANAVDNEIHLPLVASAACRGHFFCLRALFQAGADIEARDSCGQSPAMHAAFEGQVDCLRFFIENGADMDARELTGHTPLMLAAKRGHEPCLRLIAESGADLEAQNDEGRTASMIALKFGHFGCSRLLAEAGALPPAAIGAPAPIDLAPLPAPSVASDMPDSPAGHPPAPSEDLAVQLLARVDALQEELAQLRAALGRSSARPLPMPPTPRLCAPGDTAPHGSSRRPQPALPHLAPPSRPRR